MNILFISHEATRSGAPLALLYLLKEIKRRNLDISFTVLQLEGGPLTKEFQQICPVITLPERPWRIEHIFNNDTLWKKLAIRLLIQKLKGKHFDLIYSNTMVCLATAKALKGFLSVPLLLHTHEGKYNQSYLQTQSDWLRACDHFIAVSPLARRNLVELGAETDKIHVVFPTSVFIQQLLTDCPASSPKKEKTGKIVIGFIGPLIERKGADLLAKIAKSLTHLHPDCDFEIHCIGNSPELEEERQHVVYDAWRLGVADKFRHIAPTSDPVPAYQNIDILLVPSREESFSLVVPECGLLGKPVILFDGSCGVQHLLQHEQNALLVPYLDTDAVAEAIYRLSVDDKLRQTLGDQLRLTMKEHYTHNDTNSQIIQILEGIEKERKP